MPAEKQPSGPPQIRSLGTPGPKSAQGKTQRTPGLPPTTSLPWLGRLGTKGKGKQGVGSDFWPQSGEPQTGRS